MKYHTYQELARQLNINKGLASELRRKAETSLKSPKDVDKAREAVVALGELKSYLEELEVKTERVLRSSGSLTKHIVHDVERNAQFGRRGDIRGNAKKMLKELRELLDKIERGTDLTRAMFSRPGDVLKGSMELADELQQAVSKADGGMFTGSTQETYQLQKQPHADPMLFLGPVLVLIGVLASKWLERSMKGKAHQ